MDLEEVKSKLKVAAQSLSADVLGAQWYVFGSVTEQANLPADVDLLVVYQEDSDVQKLRKGLERYSLILPLHVLFLREDEEEELRFVSDQHAIRIFPDKSNTSEHF
jgi:hypothetical protein